MILHSSSASFGLSQASHFCPCKSTGTFAQNRHLFPLSLCSRSGRRELIRYWFFWHENVGRRYRFQPCMAFDYSPKRHCYGEFARMVRRSAKNVRVKQFDSELSNDDEVSQERSIQRGSNFTNFRGPPTRDKLRTQLGVINPIPFPRINRNISGLFVFFFVGVFVDKLFTARKREKFGTGTLHGAWPQVPASFSLLLEKDLQRKESVEWVNMVLEKLWKVYRAEIENWIIGLLQPVIDNLKKPDYVHRVQIKQFSLGDEPLSVRNIERRTTRLVNDLQYQIGVRYTGGARMLLTLSLNVGIIPIVVPVGVRDLDIDGELWVNLRLIPIEPWVGAVSWAFVSLPKIKVELSPFGLFNLMVPVLSEFLTKLLTEDLPLLFVRPKKVILDFLKGRPVGPVANIFKSEENHKIEEGNKDFVGELSVTLVDASKLTYIFYGKTDPYVVFKLGDQTVCSKKNSQTTIIGPPGEPIWNQDFRILVANPQNQKLSIQVKDSLGFADLTIGTGEVDLGSLQDTVPTDKIVVLQGGWGWYRSRSCGEILLRLTYKAYVEDEDDWKEEESLGTHASKDELSDFDESKTTYKQAQQNSSNKTDRESFLDVLAALIVSEKFQGIIASETSNSEVSDDVASSVPPISRRPGSNDDSKGSALFWLAVGTIILVLIVLNVGGSSFFNP